MKKPLSLIISVTLLILVVVFTLQNSSVSTIKLLFWEINASLSLMLIFTFTLGILVAVIVLTPIIIRLKKTGNKIYKKADKPENEESNSGDNELQE